jgi:hypothetical protein
MTTVLVWSPDTDTDEMIRLYVAETAHAYHVCAAFVMAGMEPPRSRTGFSAQESKIIQDHYDRYEPNGPRTGDAI